MHIYRDQDADIGVLLGVTIAVIGYGNQGRSQALNLRDSGLEVVIGNRQDEYAEQARQDNFEVLKIEDAAERAGVLMLLVPDEILSQLFADQIQSKLDSEKTLVFASGFNVAFDKIELPDETDVVLVAPRMIGSGVRDFYISGQGFPAFFGVAQDYSGNAQAKALAIAKGIGATRMGVVEVSFAQEAELDLFTEQCFGPAFGQVLVSAVDLLIEKGYPPEAVLLELYMSGEFSYTLAKIAEMGLVEQSKLHSLTSQYGSLSRGIRFVLPDLREKMADGLNEIRSGAFAREWAAEREAGYPTLKSLRDAAQTMPLYKMETELRQELGRSPGLNPTKVWKQELEKQSERNADLPQKDLPHRGWISNLIRRLRERNNDQIDSHLALPPLKPDQLESLLVNFLSECRQDSKLALFAVNRNLIVQYSLNDVGKDFYMKFESGMVAGGLGVPDVPANVHLQTDMQSLDGMFTGRIDAMRAALSGRLKFEGDTKQAINLQRIQDDLCRLYLNARQK